MTDSGVEERSGDQWLELPEPSRKNQRWTLLLVGESGRIVRIRRVRGWVTLLIALPLIALAVAAGGYLRSERRPLRDAAVAKEMARLQAEVRALREENTRLASQEVMPEPVAQPMSPPVSVTAPLAATEEPGADLPPGAQIAQPPASSAPDDREQAEPAAEAPTKIAPLATAVVEVKDLTVDLEAEPGTVEVRFKIINHLEGGESFAGYAFVILKPLGEGENQWLVFPESDFDPEGPGSFKKGFDFTISNFMFIKFKPRQIGSSVTFHTATVLIYDSVGRPVLKSDFGLDPPG